MRLTLHALAERRFTLAAAVDSARGAWTERAVLEIDVADETGALAGRGEAAPLPGYSAESLGEAAAALAALRAAGAVFEIDACLPAAPQIGGLVAAHALPPSAAFALETALLAATARAARAHPAALLRGAWPTHAVAANALLPGSGPDRAVAAARALAARGYRTFKLKVGRPGRWDEELATLRALAAMLAAEFGPEARPRADANAAWAPGEARSRLAELAPLGLEFVEQPVAPELLPDFAGSPVPLAADETLRVPGAFERLLAGGACRVVVLKPMVLGGALPCLRLARRAAAAGLGVVVTGLLDGRIAQAATAALALALDPPPLACGLTGERDLGPLLAAATGDGA